MQRILSAAQVRELDRFTVTSEPVASIDLMERACKAFVTWFVEDIDPVKKIGIVCGTGNNGGDGLGIARMLQEWNYTVHVWVVRGSVAESADFTTNLGRLEGKVEVTDIAGSPAKDCFAGCDVLIDAIFGSGLSRPPEGIYAQAIRCMNEAPATRIAVDIPSGLMADGPSTGEIVRAHYTVTFQLPKLAFLLPQSFPYTGEWIAVNIGLSKAFIKKAVTRHFLLSQKAVHKLVRPRLKFDHKGDFGHALFISGSYGKTGAAVLGSRAAMRSGLGLLTVHVPRAGYSILQSSVPEAMTSVDGDENVFSSPPETDRYDAIGVGPGLGQATLTKNALGELLKRYRKPMLIDADGLNLLAADQNLLRQVPEGSILSPHPKEFERLAGKWSDDFERLEKQKSLSSELNSVVIVKGAYSAIAAPDGTVYFNPTGNPGMASGGTGDVLSGILTALLAQGYPATEAAILGVYVHGLAGDLAYREVGMQALIASDLVEFLPHAWLQLTQRTK